jgi:hypothetical protein
MAELGRASSILPLMSLLVASFGCVQLASEEPPDPPSEELRSRFGRIAVTWSTSGDLLGGLLPAGGSLEGAGRGAVSGMAVDLKLMISGMAGAFDRHRWTAGDEFLGAIVLGISMLPVSALIGSVYGSAAVLEATTVENAIHATRAAIIRREFSHGVAESILRCARSSVDYTLVALPPGTAVDGFDTVLEVEPTLLFFQGDVRLNPEVRLMVRQSAILRRVSDRSVLYRATLIHDSRREAKFLVWAENEAKLFLSELEDIDRRLGKRLVDLLFVEHAMPSQRQEKRRGRS